MRLFFLLLALLGPVAAAAAPPPVDLDQFTWTQRPGNALPLGAAFTDQAGRAVTVAGVLGGKPGVVVLGYWACKVLCGTVREDAFAALDATGLQAGRDYNLLAVSMDPAETPADSATALAGVRARHPAPGASEWRFLTGPAASIAALSEAVGFRGRYEPAMAGFVHPAGLVVATPSGTVSAYLLGVGYDPAALRRALLEARTGAVAPPASPILMLCYEWDPVTGRYSFAVTRAMQAVAALFVLGLGAWLLAGLRRGRGARA